MLDTAVRVGVWKEFTHNAAMKAQADVFWEKYRDDDDAALRVLALALHLLPVDNNGDVELALLASDVVDTLLEWPERAHASSSPGFLALLTSEASRQDSFILQLQELLTAAKLCTSDADELIALCDLVRSLPPAVVGTCAQDEY